MATVVLLLFLPTFAAMAPVAAEQGSDLAAVRNPSPVMAHLLDLRERTALAS